MNRTLLTGIAAALVGGLLLATAAASVSAEESGEPFTVPASKVGDRVVYGEFRLEGGHTATTVSIGDAGPVGQGHSSSNTHEAERDEDGWVPIGTSTMRVDELGRTLDRDARDLAALIVRRNATYDDHSATRQLYIDLASRSLVRYDSKTESGSGFDDLSHSFFFPAGPRPYFAHQGRTFELGQDLTNESDDADGPCEFLSASASMGAVSTGVGRFGNRDVHFSASLNACEADDFDLDAIVLEHRVWIAEHATIDGRDAYALRTLTMVEFGDEIVSPEGAEGVFETLRGAKVTFRSDEWLSPDVPYAVLEVSQQDWELQSGEKARSGEMRSMLEYEPGTREVPWQAADVPAPPAPDRSPAASRYPADGDPAAIPYPLSRAVSDATDGLLAAPQLRVWMSQNPGANLVSAQLTRGSHSTSQAPTMMWNLVWATPSGSGYQVDVERPASGGAVIVSDRGTRSTPTYAPTDLLGSQVTLGQAARWWQSVAGPDGASGVSYVRWGLELNFAKSPFCTGSITRGGPSDPASELHTVYVGSTTEGSCLEQSPTAKVNVLALDSGAARLLVLFAFQEEYDFEGAPLTRDTPPQPRAQSGAHVALSPPDVRVATVASTSLLALFLAVYFLPAAKFLATKGLLLLPFYAKLRKEDLLDNRIREQILQAVKSDPGVTTTDLAKRVDAGWGTVVYHLSVLEKNELISGLVDGRFHRFFPVGVVDFSARGQVAVMRNARTKAIYDLIHEEPGVGQDALARHAGITAPSAIWHLKRLEDVGMIGRVRRGRKVHYYPNEAKYRTPPAENGPGMEVQ